jgi:L-fucose isomerase-like protein
VLPLSDEFRQELTGFVAQCRVVNSMRRARIGAVGARPNAFNTTRYSEKILQAAGISVSTMDLSDLFGRANRIGDNDDRVRARIDEICGYAAAAQVPGSALSRMAKLAVALLEWMDQNDLHASAIQCWSSMQQNFGVNVCTVMSMMSERLMPSACEVDIAGVVGMYALQLASGVPSALVDWNNNYGGDRNKCVFFHCGNWAKTFLPDIRIGTAPILGTTLGEENTYGAVAGRTPAGPVTFGRVSTDDVNGNIRAYVGEGSFTNDELATFGSRAVVEVPGLQKLMKYICRNGFEHHAAMTGGHCASILREAFETYLGWPAYVHGDA